MTTGTQRGITARLNLPTTDRISTVHVVFKTHLDLGFTALARDVVATYFERYIPQAIALARRFRAGGSSERFVWTTGSWLITEYLERAAPDAVSDMERAIVEGDIAWHALPFTTHSELMDASLFEYGLSLSQDLDRRFRKHTIAAKMTDVPGHTRGIVPLLARAGVRFLHIGVNPACRAPVVPPVFVWADPSGAELVVMYHRGTYGDLVMVPSLDAAVVFAHTGDNLGPPAADQVVATFRALQERFPSARIIASTMDRFAQALLPITHRLPRVTEEIGDTWIHGAGSDPAKVARYREVCRLRREWLSSGAASASDPRPARFSRALLMIPEHTWGLDEKTSLGDFTHYRADAFHAARAAKPFERMEASWAEQRAYLDEAVAALGESPLGAEATRRLHRIQPAQPVLGGSSPARDLSAPIETTHFTLRFDPARGAITYLRDKRSGRLWASDGHTLAGYSYQTFAQEDYERFWRQYVINKRSVRSWAWLDLTKPGIAEAGAVARSWYPALEALYHRQAVDGQQFTALLSMPEESCIELGAPRSLALEVWLPDAEPAIYLTLQWFGKQACRLPEAHWLSFQPRTPKADGWRLEKMGEWVSPLEIVRDGNRRLHAVDRGALYRDRAGELWLETLDAPLLAPGEPSLLDFTNRRPPMRRGLHVNLYNNVWGTNFPMWYDEDARFRFVLAFDRRSPRGIQATNDPDGRSESERAR